MMDYAFTRHAERMFFKLPADVQRSILKKIKRYLDEPNPLVFAEPLAGSSRKTYRFRAGDYRVIFDWEGTQILITKVGHRRDVYRA